MKKRMGSLLLALVLLGALLPLPARAAGDQQAAVRFTAQAEGAFSCAPQFDAEVSAALAQTYGYTDSVEGVSALDVLVKAHEVIFGTDFTPETAGEYLTVENGSVQKMFGVETSACGFAVNGGYPNDGTASDYGGYNGTTVATQAVSDGDLVEFFQYQDTVSWSDRLAWFCAGGRAVSQLNAAPGESVSLTLKGISYAWEGYLYPNADTLHAAGTPVAGAQLSWVDAATGALSDIDGAVTDDNGTVTLIMPQEEGIRCLTAHMPADGDAAPLLLSLTRIHVDAAAPAEDPCALTDLQVTDFASSPEPLALTPAFQGDVTSYTAETAAYQELSYLRMAYVKATAASETAVITAGINGQAAAVTSGNPYWKLFSNALKPGTNTLTVTVAASAEAGARTRTYTVKIPMAPAPGTVETNIAMDTASPAARLYAAADAERSKDLLDGTAVQEGAYTLYLAPGDYVLEGVAPDGTGTGTLDLTIPAGGGGFSVHTVTALCTTDGFACGRDYTIQNLTVQAADGTARGAALGETGETFLVFSGDAYSFEAVPSADRQAEYLPAEKSGTVRTESDCAARFPLPSRAAVGVTYPYADSDQDGENDYQLEVGCLTDSYVYTYASPVSVTEPEEGSVTAAFQLSRDDSISYFYRVSNPLDADAVTFGSFFQCDQAARSFAVTKEELRQGGGYDSTSVVRDFSENRYDTGDLYLSVNPEGWLNLSQGETFSLYPYRNWLPIEGIGNARILEPDFHVTCREIEGSDVISLEERTEGSGRHSYAITGKNQGTAVVLVTYDALTSAPAMGGSFFSAIWPENTGVFVVTVGKEGDIETGMAIRPGRDSASMLSGGQMDSELDVLYYAGKDGASYTFTPEAGTRVSMAVGRVEDGKLTIGAFGDGGVTENDDGSVTLSGMPQGKTIVKLENGDRTAYQVLRIRRAGYTVYRGTGAVEGQEVYSTEKAVAAPQTLRAGDSITIVYDTLYHPAGKFPGVYNMGAAALLIGEDGSTFQGGTGQYQFAGVPACQTVTLSIPKYWTGSEYSLEGALRVSGFGAPCGTHRQVRYETGRDADFAAKSITADLGRLPQVVVPLEKTAFFTGTLTFRDENGQPVAPENVTIWLRDGDGQTVPVGADGVFRVPAGIYSYAVTAGTLGAVGTIGVEGDKTVSITLREGVQPPVEADAQAAGKVDALIAAIGTVTLERETAVTTARAAYEALTPTQKALVGGLAALEDAEKTLSELKKGSGGTGGTGGGKISVSFRLIGSTRSSGDVDLGSGGYHGAAYETWISTRTCRLDEGADMAALVELALGDAGLSYRTAGTGYLSSIDAPDACGGYTLGEFTNGDYAGWMYTVNGKHVSRSLSGCILQDGDRVLWHYVNDYRYEVPDWSAGTLGNEDTWNRWLLAADRDPDERGGQKPSASAAADKKAAEAVETRISGIGTVTKKSAQAIFDARAAYDALTPAQKRLVGNHAQLLAAETAYARAGGAMSFQDVERGYWAEDAICYLHGRGAMNGTSAVTFDPEGPITRGMLAAILYRLEGRDTAAGAAFLDVPAGSYCAQAVAWAAENGVVMGYGDGTFRPDEAITRQQLSAMLYRYAGLEGRAGEGVPLSDFTDAGEIGAYARCAMEWAYGEGLIAGTGSGTLAPAGRATRAQTAVILTRYLECCGEVRV